MYEYAARIFDVYDADTLRVDIDLGFHAVLHKVPLRLLGIQAPELTSAAGMAARDWLRHRLPIGTEVTIQTRKRGKYGRYLAQVWDREDTNGDSINDLLVLEGHAVVWDGRGPRPIFP